MIRKLAMAAMLMMCLTLGTTAQTKVQPKGQVNTADEPKVVIEAPASVKVGDMIIMDLSKSVGDGFDMIIRPEPPQVRVFDNGKTVVTASGYETTEYLFIVSCALNGKSDVKTHVVRVVGQEPTKPVNPVKPGDDIAGKVIQWVSSVNSPTPRDDAMKLAQSFASLATVIENGTFSSPSEIVAATKASNRDALGDNLEYWIPFLEGLMTELKAMSDANMLSDTAGHGLVWRLVSLGLKDYADSLAN